MKKFILFIFLLLGVATHVSAQIQPTDTDGDGYINISTLDHLRWVSENSSSWDQNFELDNNINAIETMNWNSQTGFTPIGNFDFEFTGKFEGHGYAIKYLYINRPESNYLGLFGRSSRAEISNVGIEYCYVKGNNFVGGLIGENNISSIIFNCYISGNIIGNNYVGGLVGNNTNHSTIRNNYNTARVSGEYCVGGLVGMNVNNSIVSNSYSVGYISCDKKAGGLVGSMESDAVVINSFWDTKTSGQTTSTGGTGKTTAEMKTKSSFTDAGWNFDLVWAIDSSLNNGYPFIIDRGISDIAGIKPMDTDGDGYRNISCYSHLHWISKNDSSWAWNFELDNIINADTTRLFSGDLGFNPIWNFSGKFDGNCYVIEGLYINQLGNDNIGLFSQAQEAEITNLGITNCRVYGWNQVGGLVGNISNTSIINTYCTGDVSGNDNVSGLVGYSVFSKVINSYSKANISGNENVGNLIGYNYSSTVMNSNSSGSINGKLNVGGLVGKNDVAKVINSYSTGSVSGMNSVGGLVGNNYTSIVINSYSVGCVSSKYGYSGLIGQNFNPSMALNCFWDTLASGQTTSAGGSGKTTAEMKTKSTFTSADWNFNLVWSIDSTINNGYPYINDRGIVNFKGIEPVDTDDDGYLNISCFSHLHWISNQMIFWHRRIELDNNINADSSRLLSSDIGFTPIGNNSKYFSGKFEGNGFIIDSLYINGLGIDNIGLFGRASGAEISNIGLTNCDINGHDYVGGLIGELGYSTVNNSYSTGSISGNDNISGLIGLNYKSTVSNCYSIVTVAGINYVGGIVGLNKEAVVSKSYSTGIVSGRKYIGGFIGLNEYASVNNCFWDKQTSGIDSSAAGTGKTTAEMKTKSTFTSADWNFNLVWSIDSTINNGYPYINDRGLANFPGLIPADTDGDGFYNISCFSHLHWISHQPGYWFWKVELDNNINADSSRLLSGDIGFTPIGNGENYFKGQFEGNGFSIDSLYINREGTDFIGLFGYTDGAVISNLSVTNCQILGKDNVGGIVGKCYSSSLTKSYSTGNITGSNYVGGLIGYNASRVSNCFSKSYVSGSNKVGGLIGYNYFYDMNNCFSKGSVSGSNYIGGLVGENGSYSGFSNCYSSSSVSGNSKIGGLVGLTNEYNVKNSFWDKQTSGIDSSAGGIGQTTAEMKTKSTFTSAGWDFDTTWAIAADYNEGYPNLDGKNGASSIIELHTASLIYPQPASNEIFVKLSETSEATAKIKLFDQAGQLVSTFDTSANAGLIKLNTSALASGVYRMLINIDGKTYSEKVVLAK